MQLLRSIDRSCPSLLSFIPLQEYFGFDHVDGIFQMIQYKSRWFDTVCQGW